jgi:hypothetical protein
MSESVVAAVEGSVESNEQAQEAGQPAPVAHIGPTPVARADPAPTPSGEPKDAPRPESLTVLAMRGALGLAFVGILGALVLCVFLVVRGITSADVILIRVLLSCIAVFVATSFAAFGFALFLIKAEGALKAKLEGEAQTQTLETTAPGLVVFICAVVIMYLALHMKLTEPVRVDLAANRTFSGSAQAEGSAGSAATDGSDGSAAAPLGGEVTKSW